MFLGSERGYVQLYSSEGEMLDSWHPHEKMVKVVQTKAAHIHATYELKFCKADVSSIYFVTGREDEQEPGALRGRPHLRVRNLCP